jgi:uncharacterized RDD family membrane protein YckC
VQADARPALPAYLRARDLAANCVRRPGRLRGGPRGQARHRGVVGGTGNQTNYRLRMGGLNLASAARRTYAPFGSRFFAALVDWVLCLVVPSIVGPFLAAIGFALLWVVLVPLSIVAYFAFSYVRGKTPGMRMASIRIVDARTARPPSASKALARALTALLQAAAVFSLANFAFSDTPDNGYSTADLSVLAVSVPVAVSALVAQLWMLFDREGRTLLDRLFRLAIERGSIIPR